MKKNKIIAVVAVGAIMLSASSVSTFAYNGQPNQESGQRIHQADGVGQGQRGEGEGQGQCGEGQGERTQKVQDGSQERYGSKAELGDGTGYGRGGEGKLQGPGGEGLHDGSCAETE